MHTLSETQTRGDREKDRHRERGSEREQHTDKASSRRGPVAHPELEKQTEGSLRHTDVTLPVDWQMHVALCSSTRHTNTAAFMNTQHTTQQTSQENTDNEHKNERPARVDISDGAVDLSIGLMMGRRN